MDIIGTKIYSDSLASGIRDNYQKLLGFGVSDNEAEMIMLEAYETCIGSVYESIFWISFGYTEWRLGRLSKKIRDKVVEVIDRGDDLKKWEKVILLEPRLKADSSGLHLQMMTNLLDRHQAGDKSQSNIERGYQEYQNQNVHDIFATTNYLTKCKTINTEDLIDLSDDSFSLNIFFINGSAKKKYDSRKRELLAFRSMIDQVNPRKKVPKPYYNESPWKQGDCVALRLENLEDDYQSLNGKWIAMRIIRVIEEPVIYFLPQLAHDDKIIVSFYDFVGEKCPSQSDINNADYMIISKDKSVGNRTHQHKGVWLNLYNQKQFLKKLEWVLIDNNPDFEKVDSDFFSDGVFGAIICGLDKVSQYFLFEKPKSNEKAKS